MPQSVRDMIERRYQIQSGLELSELIENKLTKDEERIALLLIGSCFSLWRAAFLLDAKREGEDIATKGKAYLDVVLGDNNVTFYTDQKHADWTVGYYLNNAMYRLNEAHGSALGTRCGGGRPR